MAKIPLLHLKALVYYKKFQWHFFILPCPINQLWDSNERWPQTAVSFQAQTFSSWKVSQTPSRQRPAPNAGSPFLRGNMQKLFALENNFLGGWGWGESTFYLLRAAVVFCCSNKVGARSGLGFAETWLCQVKTMFSSQVHEKALSHLLDLCSAKTTAATSEGCLEQEDSWCRHHVPQAYSNATRHPAPKDGLKPGCAMPAFTDAT